MQIQNNPAKNEIIKQSILKFIFIYAMVKSDQYRFYMRNHAERSMQR